MDLLELGSFLAMLYASVIPLYMARRFFSERRSFAYLSVILGLMLLIHSFEHLGEFLELRSIDGLFGLVSAFIAVVLGAYYSFLRWRVP